MRERDYQLDYLMEILNGDKIMNGLHMSNTKNMQICTQWVHEQQSNYNSIIILYNSLRNISFFYSFVL